MDNNVSSTLPVPIFVPRIVMVATYTQDTQTHSITASVSTQTDTRIHTQHKQTKLHHEMNKHKLFQHLHPSQYCGAILSASPQYALDTFGVLSLTWIMKRHKLSE